MKIRTIIGTATFGIASPVAILHTATQRWRRQTVRVFDPYLPELHDMCWPGPKWREKHSAQ